MRRLAVVAFLLVVSCDSQPRRELPVVGPLPGPLMEPASGGGLSATLRRDVEALARLGERTRRNEGSLEAAAAFVERELRAAGLKVRRERYEVERRGGGTFENVIGEVPGHGRHELLVIGAHYDTAPGTPGADDNASAVAVLLELARRLAGSTPAHPIRFVAYGTEEPPYFGSGDMGSAVHARSLRANGEVALAMLALECLGFYRDEAESQEVPAAYRALYPTTADFLLVAGDGHSRALAHAVTAALRRAGPVPVEEIVVSAGADRALGWSDQRNFWKEGFPALLITDTAMLRNPHYHRATDTPETLDYERLAQVTAALEVAVRELAGVAGPPSR